MKKVIMNLSTPIIDIKDLNDRSYVGVLFTNGERTQLIKINKESYGVITPGNCVGDYVSLISGSSIADLGKMFNSSTFYSFDSKKEFLKWLTK